MPGIRNGCKSCALFVIKGPLYLNPTHCKAGLIYFRHWCFYDLYKGLIWHYNRVLFFKDCLFRLRKCHLDHIIHTSPQPGNPWYTLLPFYEQQTEITDWAPGNIFSGIYPSHILPYLSSVTICIDHVIPNDPLIIFLAERPIRKIIVTYKDSHQSIRNTSALTIFKALRVFEKTLTRLYLHTRLPRHIHILQSRISHATEFPSRYIRRITLVEPNLLLLTFKPNGEYALCIFTPRALCLKQ